VQVCPPTTKWLVVTNGDNEYAEHFMQMVGLRAARAWGNTPPPGGRPAPCWITLVVPSHSAAAQVREEGTGHDLVAVDFYSRFQRPTAPSCERFAAAPGLPACKRNRLRWCHTDLGANAIAYPRFVQENRRFGVLGVRTAGAAPWEVPAWFVARPARLYAVPLRPPLLLIHPSSLQPCAIMQSVSGGLGAEHFDGIMMQMLMAAGWRVKHLQGVCPFNHAPSLQVGPPSAGGSPPPRMPSQLAAIQLLPRPLEGPPPLHLHTSNSHPAPSSKSCSRAAGAAACGMTATLCPGPQRAGAA
jgi:hypothetical protein